nr:MAG TPA: hypothetical protein [Caudoviricetes sp.]
MPLSAKERVKLGDSLFEYASDVAIIRGIPLLSVLDMPKSMVDKWTKSKSWYDAGKRKEAEMDVILQSVGALQETIAKCFNSLAKSLSAR